MLRAARPCRGFGVGLLRHTQLGPRCIFCVGWLCNGHVHDATNRRARGLWQCAITRLHGVFELEGIALVLAGFRSFLVRLSDGFVGSGPIGLPVWLAGLSFTGHRGIPFDHHPSLDLCLHVGFFPQ